MYNKTYFNALEFVQNDYAFMAKKIIEVYNPKTIIEFGCGAGYLTRELIKYDVKIVALDGFFNPNINSGNLTFFMHDFNDTDGLLKLISDFDQFDLAISMEVAEHLLPEKSESFINVLTKKADKILFSAAVDYQSGTGHINCRDRYFWNTFFEKKGFYFRDIIRKKFRTNEKVEAWYALNSMYFSKQELTKEEQSANFENLMYSESYASSQYFKLLSKAQLMDYKLNLFPVKQILILRNFIKKILGKPELN